MFYCIHSVQKCEYPYSLQRYVQHSGPLLSYVSLGESVSHHTRLLAAELGCKSLDSVDIRVGIADFRLVRALHFKICANFLTTITFT